MGLSQLGLSHEILRELKFHPHHMVNMEEGTFPKGNQEHYKRGREATCAEQQAIILHLLR